MFASRHSTKLAALLFLCIATVSGRTSTLQWVDAGGRVLFSAEDIVRFDWGRQTFELKRDRAMDLMAYMVPHKHLNRAFLVRDPQGIIYEGNFVSPVSSQTYEGPIIMIGLSDVDPPLYVIHASYHGTKKEDQRFAPRFRQALEKAGVLKPIPPDHKLAPIQRVSTEWAGQMGNLRIRAEFFPETFRLGETARVHLFFVQGKSPTPNFDAVQILSTLSQSNGFFSTTDITLDQKQSLECLETGIHVRRWKPWGPTFGSIPTVAQPGPAGLRFKMILRQKTPQGDAPVYSVSLPEQQLTILPSTHAPP